jgi:hypothetical protein
MKHFHIPLCSLLSIFAAAFAVESMETYWNNGFQDCCVHIFRNPTKRLDFRLEYPISYPKTRFTAPNKLDTGMDIILTESWDSKSIWSSYVAFGRYLFCTAYIHHLARTFYSNSSPPMRARPVSPSSNSNS